MFYPQYPTFLKGWCRSKSRHSLIQNCLKSCLDSGEGYSSQGALFRVIEQCRKILDKSDTVGIVLMDLSKACDCIPHDQLLAKREV